MRGCRRRILLVFLLFSLAVTAGCAHYPVNPPMAPDRHDRAAEYRFKNLSAGENSDSLFVILAFSGGGTRAAALSFGVLKKLKDTSITWEGEKRRLLDEVDVISSVSGGSFTAAYFALYGDGIFSDFESKFLKRNIERELAARLLWPVNWFRLPSFTFDRIDLAAEYYDENVFEGATFGDLARRGKRPFVVINATDMSQGARFEFTQDQFDPLCSDLSGYPVARAVAASSAFPVLLSPITINNYAGRCGYFEPVWVANALSDRDISARRFSRAVLLRSYQDSSKRPYIHLMDGGIADNIGLRGPIASLASTDTPGSLLRMIDRKLVKKVVIIVVNAKTEPDTTLDQRESPPNLRDVLGTVANAPMDNYSFETIELLRESIGQWEKDAQARADCKQVLASRCPGAGLPGGELAQVGFYTATVGFDALADADERGFFKNLPTTFHLPADTIDRLRDVGGRILGESKDFRALLQDLQ